MRRLYIASLSLTAIIVALILILLFFSSYDKIYLTNINFIKNNYSLTSSYCGSFGLLRGIGLEKMCVQTYRFKAQSQYNITPINPIIVYTFYKFNSSTSASSFVNDVSMDLNTTPWPSGIITNKSSISNYTYTTEYFPTINNGNPMWVYTLYYTNNSKVISLSVINSTKGVVGSLSEVVKIMDYLKANISRIN
jgi:hypothetical protein